MGKRKSTQQSESQRPPSVHDERAKRLQAQVDNMQRIEELARTIHNLQSASLRGDEYAIEMVQQAAADLAAELRKRDEQNPAA